MASRHKTAQTMLAALLLVMSCMVFLAPGLQSASAESSAAIVDDVVPAVEEETEEETVEEAEPVEEYVPEEPETPPAPEPVVRSPSVAPGITAFGDRMEKDAPPMHHMEKKHPPVRGDEAEPITDSDLIAYGAPEDADGAPLDKPSVKPSEKPDYEGGGIVAFGNFIDAVDPAEPSDKPSMKPSEKPDVHTEPVSVAEKPVVSVKINMILLQAMIYDMIASVGEMSDDADQFDRNEEDDGTEDAEDCIIYVTDESEEEPAPVPETVIPGEFYTPPESDSLADALRAEQVVSQLA